MKAYFPYVYSMAYVPPKRVKPVHATCGGTIEVDVPEISLSETTLVASLDYVVERPEETFFLPTEFRTWNGSLLARVTDETFPVFKTSWLPSSPGAKSSMPPAFKPLYGFVLFDGDEVEQYARGDLSGVDFHEPPADRVVWSHGERHLSTVRRLSGDLVSVDGELWRKTEFVGLCLHAGSIDVRPHWASLVQKPYGFLPFTRDSIEDRMSFPGRRKMFDVTQTERLLHHAGEVGAEFHFRSLVVHDPVAIAFDGERNFIGEAMDFTVLVTEGDIGEMSASAIAAWTAMRSAVERVSAHNAEDFAETEIEAFWLLASEYRGERAGSVHKALAGCEEYMNDPWGRYASARKPPRDLQNQGI
jgi:hypothetical protein